MLWNSRHKLWAPERGARAGLARAVESRAKPLHKIGLGKVTACEAQHGVNCLIGLGLLEAITVPLDELDHRQPCSPLVAIGQRMVLGEPSSEETCHSG
jgi:hypothetical protein